MRQDPAGGPPFGSKQAFAMLASISDDFKLSWTSLLIRSTTVADMRAGPGG